MSRPALLYVTPLMPDDAGNGLAMRAGAMLAALAMPFEVHLAVLPVAGAAGPPGALVRRNTVRHLVIDPAETLDPLFALIEGLPDPAARAAARRAYPRPLLSRSATGTAALQLLDWARPAMPRAVHVMRLYLAPLIEPFLRLTPAQPFTVLDLDEDDAAAGERLAALHDATGEPARASAVRAEAQAYRGLAARLVPKFDRVAVAAATESRHLAALAPAPVAVLPNTVAPRPPRPQRPACGPLRLLFVATFGHAPNADAARFLCLEVLPALRRLTGRAIAIDLVGAGDTGGLRDLPQAPEVTLHGYVADLRPYYAAADVAVAPLRAGGGTRIKLLEAFAHGVPVVATPLAAAGLDARDGVHLRLADTAEAFAEACREMAWFPDQAARLAAQARHLVEVQYGPARLHEAVARLYGPVTGAEENGHDRNGDGAADQGRGPGDQSGQRRLRGLSAGA